MKKQLLLGGLCFFPTILQPLLAENLRAESSVVRQERQQVKKVMGKVLDAAGMPIIGANVMIKGTTNGTITDMDGKFSLDVEEGDVLSVSYIGFDNQEVKVSGGVI